MKIEITRRWSVPDNSEFRATTTGTVSIDGTQICFSLEPTALMIPAGSYTVNLAWSPRFERMTPHIMGVPGRTEIEIHGGNVATDSEGCILVAEKRITDYQIYLSPPAVSAIEEGLQQAFANGEWSTVEIIESLAISA